jgi:hypothetical protein
MVFVVPFVENCNWRLVESYVKSERVELDATENSLPAESGVNARLAVVVSQ